MSYAFALIVVSAVFHAVWNLLVKTSDDKVAYNVHIQVATAVFITSYTVFSSQNLFIFINQHLYMRCFHHFFFALYQHFTAVSYKYADVSLAYPITTSSPFFIMIWAYFILDERVTPLGILGIVLVLSGCYIMNITKGKGNKSGLYGILIAILAAFYIPLVQWQIKWE